MDWKKRYETIDVGDKVKLLYIDSADRGNGLLNHDIGRIFTVENVTIVNTTSPEYEKIGGMVFGMDKDEKTGYFHVFYLKQLEKV